MAMAWKCSDGGCGILRAERWTGICPGCGGYYNCKRVVADIGGSDNSPPPRGELCSLNDVQAVSYERISTGHPGIDRMLGMDKVTGQYGLAAKAGQAIQIYGDPGAGKSTLVLQICQKLSEQRHSVLYFAGEESLPQIKARSERLGKFNSRMQVIEETDLDHILELIDEHQPTAVVIDSIQKTRVGEYVPGSLTAISIAAEDIYKFCQARGVAPLIICQVNRDGGFAGPRALEHTLDTSLSLKVTPDKLRILECESKNRFGFAPQHQYFEMSQTTGTLIEIPDPKTEGEEGVTVPTPPPPASPPTLRSVP